MTAHDVFWLSPLLPLTVFGVLASGLAVPRRVATGLAIGAAGGSTMLSIVSLIEVIRGERAQVSALWLGVGDRPLALALMLDPLGAIVATLVGVIALVVFMYAATYMANDPHVQRFFALMSLFIGAMLALVLAADLITLFIAWELVGLCSGLLIGFWFARPGAGAAATEAFLVTRFGDLAMLLAVLLLVVTVGTSSIDAALAAIADGQIPHRLLVAAGLLLIIAAATKSAQLPFQGWLPDAMVGPTPVSALLHSATMVAAGVFLIARLYPLFEAAAALEVIAWTGVATAWLGGAAALVERDLKRALAYSTMSQLGLMFVGLGAGSVVAGVMLLIAHAFYKAVLFLAAGVIDHAAGGTEFTRMGGLARRLPWTFVGVVIAATALAGLPVTLALPPKDAVVSIALITNPSLFWFVLGASLLTALYTARIVGLAFLGLASTPTPNDVRERRGLFLPAVVLAVLLPFALLVDARIVGGPLEPVLGGGVPHVPGATAAALLVAAIGVGSGLWARARWPTLVVWPPLRAIAPLASAEFGLRPLYVRTASVGLSATRAIAEFDRCIFDPVAETVAAGVLAGLRWASRVDRAVFDAMATGVTDGALRAIQVSARFDVDRIEAVVTRLGRGVLRASEDVRRLQTGRVEHYLLPVFVWGVLLIAVAALVVTAT